ncbi:hypothetical protein 7F23_19 [uncultured Caudovirales phage]|uniref:S1 motif domain-containing protein n=1 Tax=uncultured Caudovirales phage TaxID=2100421 RepID=A0A2H4J242_9CAUD|nr:hypothetical protein 7F23_19 [uncultured Caudovirales phage]
MVYTDEADTYKEGKVISGNVKFVREDRFFMGFYEDKKLKEGYVPRTEMTKPLSEIKEGELIEVKIIEVFDSKSVNGLILSMIIEEESLDERQQRLEKLNVQDTEEDNQRAEYRARVGIYSRFEIGDIVKGKVIETYDKTAPRASWIKYKTIAVQLKNPRTGEVVVNYPNEKDLLPLNFKKRQEFTFKLVWLIPEYCSIRATMILEEETYEEEKERLSHFGLVPERDITYIEDKVRVSEDDLELERRIEEQIREDAWEYNENH